MSKLKMGRKGGPRESAKRFEQIYRRPLSKRIVNFLKEEARKEKVSKIEKKIAKKLNYSRWGSVV
ncbi:MAG: hypothetical protein M9899_04315 [Bdellovibrionaceae bacterium]|nr:hypothetical protein [Pseudobdellovibrionaceae bacterium]